MPASQVVIWAVAVFLIVSMLGIIGYLISNGFTSLKADLKAELQKLWEKLDKHQDLAENNAGSIRELRVISGERVTACGERHRLSDAATAERWKTYDIEIASIRLDIAHLRQRKDGNHA